MDQLANPFLVTLFLWFVGCSIIEVGVKLRFLNIHLDLFEEYEIFE